jgi:hypothetical protein
MATTALHLVKDYYNMLSICIVERWKVKNI